MISQVSVLDDESSNPPKPLCLPYEAVEHHCSAVEPTVSPNVIDQSIPIRRSSTEGARVESGCLSNERVSGILIWVRQTSWIVMGERRCDVSKDSLSPLYLS